MSVRPTLPAGAIAELPDGYRGPVWWSNVEAALVRWIERVLEFDDGKVIWERQGVPQPRYPYASLLRTAVTTEGGSDESRSTDAGGTYITQYRNNRAFTLTVQCHTDRDCGPDDDAMALAERLRSSLYQSPPELEEACIAVVRDEPIQDVSTVLNADWISRSALDIRFRVTALEEVESTYIETVQVASVGIEPPITLVVDSTE